MSDILTIVEVRVDDDTNQGIPFNRRYKTPNMMIEALLSGQDVLLIFDTPEGNRSMGFLDDEEIKGKTLKIGEKYFREDEDGEIVEITDLNEEYRRKFDIEKDGDYKVKSRRTGRTLGAHSSWEKAREQQKAIYANIDEESSFREIVKESEEAKIVESDEDVSMREAVQEDEKSASSNNYEVGDVVLFRHSSSDETGGVWRQLRGKIKGVYPPDFESFKIEEIGPSKRVFTVSQDDIIKKITTESREERTKLRDKAARAMIDNYRAGDGAVALQQDPFYMVEDEPIRMTFKRVPYGKRGVDLTDREWSKSSQGPVGTIDEIVDAFRNSGVSILRFVDNIENEEYQYDYNDKTLKKMPEVESSFSSADLIRDPNNIKKMSIADIAHLVQQNWEVTPYAAPYLNAMTTLHDITDSYGADSGASIVAYFLSNSEDWKGPVARVIKRELNRRLNSVYRRRT